MTSPNGNGNTSNGSSNTTPSPGVSHSDPGAGVSGGSFAYAAALETMRGETLSSAERRQLLAEEQGVPFDPFQRLFASFDQGRVFQYGEEEAADYRAMLARSGKARSLEAVLTLPLRGAPWKITADDGDAGQAALVEDNLGDKLNMIIDQMTSAITYRRAFFETSWEINDKGQVIYSDVALRPATGCEAGFDPATGRPRGFRQRIVPVAGFWPSAKGPGVKKSGIPGYVIVNPNRAFIYVHGQHRDPINGTSDMDVALWCWQTLQKVMFLWFSFLEAQALPKTLIYGDDDAQAEKRAQLLAGLKSSGVLGISRSGAPGEKTFDVLESSGKGADQFEQAIRYLESSMMGSALAGFTELPAHTSGTGSGSYALSADQSEFFMASRQAAADEIADVLRRELFAPLVAYNYGIKAPVPRIQVGPLSKDANAKAFDLLKTVALAPTLNVPRDFVDQLTVLVSGIVGLDQDQIHEAIKQDAIDRKKQAEALAEQMKQPPAVQGVPGGATAPAGPRGPQAGPSTTPVAPGQPRPGRPPAGRPAPKAAPPRPQRAVAASVERDDLLGAVDTAYRLVTAQAGD